MFYGRPLSLIGGYSNNHHNGENTTTVISCSQQQRAFDFSYGETPSTRVSGTVFVILFSSLTHTVYFSPIFAGRTSSSYGLFLVLFRIPSSPLIMHLSTGFSLSNCGNYSLEATFPSISVLSSSPTLQHFFISSDSGPVVITSSVNVSVSNFTFAASHTRGGSFRVYIRNNSTVHVRLQ